MPDNPAGHRDSDTGDPDRTPSSPLRTTEIESCIRFVLQRSGTNTAFLLEQAGYLYNLINVLIRKGIITEEESQTWRREISDKHTQQWVDLTPPLHIDRDIGDKYALPQIPVIDCENRVHLCKSACCRMRFALSEQDLDEGVIRWDIARPYLNRQNENGYCVHSKQDRCSEYDHRPGCCRQFDCRNDRRIWLDFEGYVVNPNLDELIPHTPGSACGDHGVPRNVH